MSASTRRYSNHSQPQARRTKRLFSSFQWAVAFAAILALAACGGGGGGGGQNKGGGDGGGVSAAAAIT